MTAVGEMATDNTSKIAGIRNIKMLYSGLLSHFWLGRKSSFFPETLVALCGNTHFICTLEVKELRHRR